MPTTHSAAQASEAASYNDRLERIREQGVKLCRKHKAALNDPDPIRSGLAQRRTNKTLDGLDNRTAAVRTAAAGVARLSKKLHEHTTTLKVRRTQARRRAHGRRLARTTARPRARSGRTPIRSRRSSSGSRTSSTDPGDSDPPGAAALPARREPRECECGCGAEFIPRRKDQRFLDRKHRDRAGYERGRRCRKCNELMILPAVLCGLCQAERAKEQADKQATPARKPSKFGVKVLEASLEASMNGSAGHPDLLARAQAMAAAKRTWKLDVEQEVAVQLRSRWPSDVRMVIARGVRV